MTHAGPGTLARIAPLLEQLRGRPVLRERRAGVFELKSRAFLHFHDDPSGILADVRLGGDVCLCRPALGFSLGDAKRLEPTRDPPRGKEDTDHP